MKFLLAWAALLAPATVLSAQAPLADPSPSALARVVAPSPAALELAALLPGAGPARAESAGGRVEDRIARQFLNTMTPRGWACDPEQSECRRIASAMAAELSPKLAEWSKRRWQIFAAYFLQASLSDADMRDAIAFFGSPGGARTAAALARIAAPRTDSEADLAVYAKAMEALPQPPQPDFDAFFVRTRHLPRRTAPFVPPPPIVTRPDSPHSD